MEHINPFIFIAEFSPDLGAKIEWLTELRPQVRAACPDPSETWKYFPLCSHPITETSFQDAQRWRGLLIRTEDEDTAHRNFDDPNVHPVEVDTQLWPAASALYEQQSEYLFRCYLHKEGISIAKTTEVGQGNSSSSHNNNNNNNNNPNIPPQQHYSKIYINAEDLWAGTHHPFFDDIRDVVNRIFEEVPQLNGASNNNNNNVSNSNTTVSPVVDAQQQRGTSTTPKSFENSTPTPTNNNTSNATPTPTTPAQNQALSQAISNIQVITFTAPQFHHATVLACVFQIRDPDVRAETRSLTVALCHPDFSVVSRNASRLTDGLVNFAANLIRESQFLGKTVTGQLYQPDPLFVRFAQYWGFEKNSENHKHQPPGFYGSNNSNNNNNNNDTTSSSGRGGAGGGSGRGGGTTTGTGLSGGASTYLSQQQYQKRKVRIYSQSLRKWHTSFTRILSSIVGPPIDPTASLMYPSVAPLASSILSSMSVSSSSASSPHMNQNQQNLLAFTQQQQQQLEQNMFLYQVLRERDMAFRTTLLTLRRYGIGYPDIQPDLSQMNILTDVLSALFKGELIVLLPVTPEDTTLVSDLASALASLLPPNERKVLSDIPVDQIKSEEPFFNIIAARWSPEIQDGFLEYDVGAEANTSTGNEEDNNNKHKTSTEEEEEQQVSEEEGTKRREEKDENKETQQHPQKSSYYSPREGAVVVKISYNGGVTNILTSDNLYLDCRSTDIHEPRSVPCVAKTVVRILVDTPSDEPIRTLLAPVLEVAQKIASGYISLLNAIFLMATMSNKNGGIPSQQNQDDPNNSLNGSNQNTPLSSSTHLRGEFGNPNQQASRTPRNNNNFAAANSSGGLPYLTKRDSDGLSDGGFSTGFANDSFDERQKSLILYHYQQQHNNNSSSSALRTPISSGNNNSTNFTSASSSNSYKIPKRQRMPLNTNNNDYEDYDDNDDDDDEETSPRVKGSFAGTLMSKLKSMFSRLDDSSLTSPKNVGRKGHNNNDSGNNSVASFHSMATTKANNNNSSSTRGHHYNPVPTAPVSSSTATTVVANNNRAPASSSSAAVFHHHQYQNPNNRESPQHQNNNSSSTSNNNSFNNNRNNSENYFFSSFNANNNNAISTSIHSDYLMKYLHTNIDMQDNLSRDQKILLWMVKKTISIEDRTNHAMDPENVPPPPPVLTPAEVLCLFYRLSSHVAVSYFPELFSQPTEADVVCMMHLARKKSSRRSVSADE